MIKIMITIILLVFCQILYAQHFSNDTIYPVKVNLNTKYYQRGKLLRMPDLTLVLATNHQADKQLRKSKGLMVGEYMFALAGGFLIGYELGKKIGGDEVNWAIMGPGFGAIGLSIAFGVLAKEKKRNAIELFNKELKQL